MIVLEIIGFVVPLLAGSVALLLQSRELRSQSKELRQLKGIASENMERQAKVLHQVESVFARDLNSDRVGFATSNDELDETDLDLDVGEGRRLLVQIRAVSPSMHYLARHFERMDRSSTPFRYTYTPRNSEARSDLDSPRYESLVNALSHLDDSRYQAQCLQLSRDRLLFGDEMMSWFSRHGQAEPLSAKRCEVYVVLAFVSAWKELSIVALEGDDLSVEAGPSDHDNLEGPVSGEKDSGLTSPGASGGES